MSQKPEALRLADALERMDTFTEYQRAEILHSAAELRRLHKENEQLKTVPMKYRRMQFNAELQNEVDRLHALNQELLEPLLAWEKAYCDKDFSLTMRQFDVMVRAAIAKAEAA